MNFDVLRLLLDPRGAINRKEFRFGICLLFLCAVYYLFNLIFSTGHTALIGQQDTETLALFSMLKPTVIPNLPVVFILFYSSLVLATKRVKDVGDYLWLGILTGLFIFLFFNAIFLNVNNNAAILNLLGLPLSEDIKLIHLTINAISVTLGLIALIPLSLTKGQKEQSPKEKYLPWSLSITQLATQMTIMYLVLITLTGAIGILVNFYIDSELLLKVLIGSAFLILVWYFFLVYMRLKYTDGAFYQFMLCFVFYLASLLTVIKYSQEPCNINHVNFSLSLLSVASAVFTLANVFLFLLKDTSTNEKTLIIKDN